MSFNTFGKLFRFTTWGESHGLAIGCVVDGSPPGIKITEKDIIKALKQDRSRSPSLLLLVYVNGRETHVGVDKDTFKKKASSYFGTDEDGEEIEFEINDVSRIE